MRQWLRQFALDEQVPDQWPIMPVEAAGLVQDADPDLSPSARVPARAARALLLEFSSGSEQTDPAPVLATAKIEVDRALAIQEHPLLRFVSDRLLTPEAIR